jgi:hypothetical protein
MGKAKDLTGEKFGKLIALNATDNRDANGCILWECKCDCGNLCYVISASLIRGKTNSCGCYNIEQLKARFKNLIGLRFGRLVVVKKNTLRARGVLWDCVCDCNNEITVESSSLLSKHTRSCGCISKELGSTNLKEFRKNNPEKIGYVLGTFLPIIKSKKIYKSNTSGVIGVYKCKNRWKSLIQFKNKQYYLGLFEKKEDAQKAYQKAKEQKHLNFINWYEKEYKLKNISVQQS